MAVAVLLTCLAMGIVAGTTDSDSTDHRFFLHEIFTKYGHDGHMTFEGFEHLLESLGVGNFIIEDHDVVAHQGNAFQNKHLSHEHPRKDNSKRGPRAFSDSSVSNRLPEVPHDTEDSFEKRNHAIESDRNRVEVLTNLTQHHREVEEVAHHDPAKQCMSPREILETFDINPESNLNPVAFLHLCPAIIYELDQRNCLLHGHDEGGGTTTLHQWMYASAAVVLISLCGLLSVAVIPIMQKWFYQTILQFLIGLAVGSLSGDGLLHLMPHAMLGEGGHGHEADEKLAVWRGLAALAGIFLFFLAERVLVACRKKQTPDLDMLPENSNKDFERNVGEKLCEYKRNSYDKSPHEGQEIVDMLPTMRPRSRTNSKHEIGFHGRSSFASELPVAHGHGHSHDHQVPESASAVAWMVIMGDGLHNFCDGLAIGAAFASGVEGGISTTVAVFCHELPHELGDFAMLLKTGMKVKEALYYNGLSSVLCFIGMAIGVALGNVHSATSWVFACTAGIFLYIALVDMLPELVTIQDYPFSNAAYTMAVQVLGMCTGISIMLLIANYEHDLKAMIS